MIQQQESLEFADALPAAQFRELHKRTVNRPIDEVWPHCLNVRAKQVRTLGPLLALRELPAVLSRKGVPRAGDRQPLLDVFAGEGFVILRRDQSPSDGRALVIFGAASKFWSLTANAPMTFDSPQAFLDFNDPDYAKMVSRLEAIDLGDGTTRIETETVVAGTDAKSTRKFAPYWALIRLPSGLIRRSWLAAIDRRASL